eukprot:TRINITY_DN3313_c0_g1_i1.p1 TRINITY_DN3313_c0_g1~~TRINITY_DN3313_c0_g1_i1.p1  ORF type:complete len:803 (+),score=154.32 TRINITY_DN3313_c0_g1_i1:49-2409(+)
MTSLVLKGDSIWSIPLSECTVGSSVAECAERIPDSEVVESVEEHCLQWNDDKMADLEGTSYHYELQQLQDKYRDCDLAKVSTVYRQMLPTIDNKVVVLPGSQLSKRVSKQNHKPNCEYVISEDRVCLRALEDFLVSENDSFSRYSACFTTELSANLTESLYDVTVADKGSHPGNFIEIAFEVPPETVPILAPHFVGSECSVIEGNVTKHKLTTRNPYPLELRLAARSHQVGSAGDEPTEDSVDCCLEKLLSSMKESITKKNARWDIRAAELDILISSLSRLSHGTTLRKNGPCHKILREPPVVRGETLAGVPLHKCLNLATALEHPAVCNNNLHESLTDLQIRTLQVCVLMENVISFLPKLSTIEVPPPCMWSAKEVDFLKGTSCYDKVLQLRKNMTNDLTHLRTINGPNVSTETYQYATSIVHMCSVDVVRPEEVVTVDVSQGTVQPVTWVDYDGDRISFRLNESKQLIYSLNSEDRPPIVDMEVINNGIGLRFPSIDREVDLVEPTSPNNAYQLIFSTIRSLAEAAGVKHDIPEKMEFIKPSKSETVIAPGAAMLPNRPTAAEPVFKDGTVWFTAEDSQEGASESEQLAVAHMSVGNTDLVALRGEFFKGNPFSSIPYIQKIPCRSLGAAESDSDIVHGIQLSVFNMLSESSSDVAVALPDLDSLQNGETCFFSVTHKLSTSNFGKSLLWFELLNTIPLAVFKETKTECTTLQFIRNLIRQHADLKTAVAEVCKLLDSIGSGYPEKTDSWDEENPKRQLAMELSAEELAILESIKGSLQSMEKF